MKPIFEPKFNLGETLDDTFRVQFDPIFDNMMDNFSQMLRDAEDQWYVEQVIKILETKGYTVSKNENAD